MNRKIKSLIAGLGLAAIVIAGAACANTTPPTPAPSSPSTSVQPSVPSQSADVPISNPAVPATSSVAPRGINSASPVGAPSYASSSYMQVGNNGQSGILVTGEATVKAEPDMAILNIGVEARALTVEEANREAAEAMEAIIQVLRNRGLEDKDIKTTSYNVWPQYEYTEVMENGRRVGKQELVGFQVSNSTSVNVRDLETIGELIDEVSIAGGDATRINGINFTLEDPKPLMNGLREAAVGDAMAKAQQFADLTSVGLGRLVFITETGGSAPVMYYEESFARGMAAMDSAMAPMPSTPVSGGELEFRLGVQAVFEIQ